MIAYYKQKMLRQLSDASLAATGVLSEKCIQDELFNTSRRFYTENPD